MSDALETGIDSRTTPDCRAARNILKPDTKQGQRMSQALAYACPMFISVAISNDQRPHEDPSTQVYRELKAAQSSETQARTLVEIMQADGVVEAEPPEGKLARTEQYLLAEPFQQFAIEMSSGASYGIERRGQCGFTRQGSVPLSGVGEFRWCLLDPANIIRVTMR